MCLFCKIANKEIPASILAETTHALAFRDLHPVAPEHVLVIPKRHIASVDDATIDDVQMLGEVLLLARNVAHTLGLSADGYRLVSNTGRHAGQSVFHWHIHLLGGREFSWPPG
jgi:histidine triad (HIT) family protein